MKNEATIDGITVGGQPSADELQAGRFKSVINLRLDDEPGNDDAALLAGTDVAYTPVPVTIETFTKDDIDRVRRAVAEAAGPVLIHCMAGLRAAVAAAIVAADEDGSGLAGARTKLATAGFDIAGTPYENFVTRYFTSESHATA